LSTIESEEGGGDQQMTPELLIKAFSAKSTQFMQSKRRKEPYNIALDTSKLGTMYVAGSAVLDTLIHTGQLP
jgi:hypothetical protein